MEKWQLATVQRGINFLPIEESRGARACDSGFGSGYGPVRIIFPVL